MNAQTLILLYLGMYPEWVEDCNKRVRLPQPIRRRGKPDPPVPHLNTDISDCGKIITKSLAEQKFIESSGLSGSQLKSLREEFLDGVPIGLLEDGHVAFGARPGIS